MLTPLQRQFVPKRLSELSLLAVLVAGQRHGFTSQPMRHVVQRELTDVLTR